MAAQEVPEVVKGRRVDLLSKHITDGCIGNHVSVQEGESKGQQPTREPQGRPSKDHGLDMLRAAGRSLSSLKATGPELGISQDGNSIEPELWHHRGYPLWTYCIVHISGRFWGNHT